MSRGVALPRRGSPGDLVLRELMLREYTTKVAETGLLARVIGFGAGLPMANLNAALELYHNELTHARYTPQGAELNKKILSSIAKPTETRDDMRERLKRIAALDSSS